MTTTPSRAPRPTALLRIAALTLLSGLALAACGPAGSADHPGSDKSRQLAAQLDKNLKSAGLSGLDSDTARTLYGTDGGATCENAGKLQHHLSLAQFGNNSGNLRRVAIDPTLLRRDLVVVKTYCPDKEGKLRKVIDDLDAKRTIP